MLRINGVDMPMPKSLKVIISDVDGDAGRNANGIIVRDRIAIKRKIECEWAPLTQSQTQQLLSAVSGVFFNVTFIDPKDGQVTKTMYVGDRNAPVYSYCEGLIRWSGLSMNFIEQ